MILAALMLGTITTGCKSTENINPVPPMDNGTKSIMVEISDAEFIIQANLVKDAEVVYPGSVVVILVSNASTGFSWTTAAVNSNPGVISQTEHNYLAPDASGVGGAAGKEVWTFKPQKTGTATLIIEYSQPWDDGQKAVRTLSLTITVK